MKRLGFVCLQVLALSVCLASAALAQPAPAAVVEWSKAHARPLVSLESLSNRDLEAFAKPIGRARVIGLGEPQHGLHESFVFRNAFAKFAVESLGVTAIAVESGYTESVAVDDYVVGRGALTPSIVAAVFSWSSDTSYDENRQFIDWLRSYNARATTRRKVHFYGIDLTGGRGGRFTEARRALDAALDYVASVDPNQGRDLRKRIDPLIPSFASGPYDSLSAEQQNALSTSIEDLAGLFERRSAVWPSATSREAFDRAYRSAIVARQLNQNFRSAAAESNPQAQRESAMANNLMWALQREGDQGRILLYEASWHISKGPMESDRWGSSLGEHLQASLGADYFAIATSFGELKAESGDGASDSTKPDPQSAASLLSGVCRSICWIDLHEIPNQGEVFDWFSKIRPIQGGRVDKVVPAKAFDAVVYIPSVHSAKPAQ